MKIYDLEEEPKEKESTKEENPVPAIADYPSPVRFSFYGNKLDKMPELFKGCDVGDELTIQGTVKVTAKGLDAPYNDPDGKPEKRLEMVLLSFGAEKADAMKEVFEEAAKSDEW